MLMKFQCEKQLIDVDIVAAFMTYPWCYAVIDGIDIHNGYSKL